MSLPRSAFHVFTAVTLGIVLTGCGGSGGGTPTNPGPVPTTTTLSVSPTASVTTTTPVTLTATVSSTGGGTPTGSVTFLDGTTTVGTGTLASGTATVTLSTPAAGSHSFTARYPGTAGYSTSTSSAVALTVAAPPAATTATLTIAPDTNVTTTTPVTLTASVTSSGGTPTGTITFLDGTTSLGTANLASGTATLTISTLTAGSHSFTASYAGTSSFAASVSSAAALTVTTASTTTTLTVSPDTNVTDTTPLALTATVTASSGTPTGTLTFLDGTTSLGTASLASGTATLNLSTLAAGSHSLSASYAGNSSFAASTSSAFALTVTSASVINAHATFSFATANQTITGFGAAEAFYVNWLDSLPAASQTAIYKALFDPTQGLGLNYLRVQDLYRNGAADTDTPKVVSAANTAHGSPLTIIMSSWSPTADLKSNGATTGGGTLIQKSGAYDYAGFAQYWYNSLTAYAALGVSPDYISIQNEPDFNASYDSCLFSATEGSPYAGYGKAFDAVYNSINGGSLVKVPQMIGPETLSAGSSFLSLAGSVSTTEIAAYAHHLYNVPSASTNPDLGLSALQGVESAYPTQTKFMTEYYDAPGFLTAWNIHNAFTVANDNAYIFWGATWPSALDATGDQAADQQGLIYIDNPFDTSSWKFTQGWTYNDAYYAMKHYSYYIKPGYIRYNATVDNTDERVSVYQSPDQKTTIIVALNVSTTATDDLALDLSTVTYKTSALYRSTFSQPITTGERWASLGAYDSTDGITLAPQSAVTIVLTN